MVNDTPAAPSVLSVEEKRRLLVQKLQQRAQRDTFPLSFSQQRLWFLHRLDPESPAYNIPLALRARGPLDPAVLRRALRALVRRHDALRTTFAEREGRAVQVVGARAADVLVQVDLRGMVDADRERELARLVAESSTRPFDLERGPLLRAVAVHLADEEWGLLFTLHHVVADGWSMGVLGREVSELYAALAEGREPALPPLRMQYPEFALWQRGWLRGEVLEAETSFWREQLAGAPHLLELPTDRPRPAVAGLGAGSRTFAIDGATAQALGALARAEGVTLFMTLLSAWQLLLSRWSGQDDVLVGTPIAGRTREEVEGLIGLFLNTLVIRARLEPGLTFRGLLAQVREHTLGAFAHQNLPFEKLVEELAVERSLAHGPLFQVVFALQNNERAGLALGDARFEAIPTGVPAAKFDLVLTAQEGPEGIGGNLVYRTDLFDGATAERLLEHYAALLRMVATDADRPLSAYALLGPAERRQVLEEWNATDAPAPELLVHERFAVQALLTPDAPAVVFGDRSMTYGELDAASNRLAHHLRAAGVGVDDRVGLLLERSAETVVTVLAILKAGAAYVALDPSYPDDRLHLMLVDADASAVVTRAEMAERIGGCSGAIVQLDRDADAIASRPSSAPRVDVAPGNLAYVIYTSGSTGTPKGVLIEHRGLANYLAWFDRAVLGDDGFALPMVSRLSFDAHVRQLFPPLLRGESVWVLPEETVGDPRALLDVLSTRDRVSFGGVPSLWSAMVEMIRAGEATPPAGLKAVLLGGEALSPELVERTRALFPGAAIWNHYGPTEATVNTTVARVDGADRVTIGRPIANVRVYLLDGGMQPVPVGIPGELYVGGTGVSRGYLGRPALTAEKFIPNPFSGVPGARMYRSGDRVRWRADGELDYVGRIDHQVKVRGFRIEPGEIEVLLERHPSVREAAVVVREDAGSARLVGYVVGEADAAPSVPDLRAYLKARLPDYMVPAAMIVLDAFPVTPNGKVDRRALPAPDAVADEDAYVAPRTPTEEILAGLFAEVLKVDQVGAEDEFFALGGHSLMATRLISRIREAFAIELPLRALFEASSVEALAQRVDAMARENRGGAAPPIVPVDRDRPLPLSFAQQRLWFIDQLEPGSAAYNIPYALRLRGPLDVAALERSITTLVARHEVLRTRFPSVDGEPVQVIDPAAPIGVTRIDLSAHAEAEAELRALAVAESRRPFDLATGPLFRSTLVRLGEDEHAVLFTLHHIVSDGWSSAIVVREVSELYAAFAEGRDPYLPDLPVQYADFAAWQRAWLNGDVLDAQLGYWRERLADARPRLELPADHPAVPGEGDRAATASFSLSAETSEALRALSRREGATLFMTLLAAWQLLLARYGGEDDVSVGTPVAGRTRLETEGLIGFFINTLVLRTDLSGGPSFRELVRRARETTLGAYQHQDIPFEKLVEEMAPERALGHTPFFQVMFALQNAASDVLSLGGVRFEAIPTGVAAAKFDLVMTAHEGGDAIGGTLVYRAARFEPATAERMVGHYAALLRAVAAEPDRPGRAHALPGEAERRRVLEEWNATDAPLPTLLVHERFAGQAMRTPDAPAVVFGVETLTYAELDARSARLAHHLRAAGVDVDDRVGLLLERSAESVVAVLAILRAGAAYVALDPSYPDDRLRFMLADAGASAVVTRSEMAGRISGFPGAVVRLDADADEIAAHPAEAPQIDVSPENLAYVIYTSGSTGTPKGALIEHRGLANYLAWFGREVLGDDGFALPMVSRLSFDAHVRQLFPPLLRGEPVWVLPEETVGDPRALLDALSTAPSSGGRVSFGGVPSLWGAMVELIRAGEAAPPAGLTAVLLGGEALSPDLVAKARDLFPGVPIFNHYGPTEATVNTTVARVDGGVRVTIGRPIANVRVYLLDGQMHPVPIGIPGELYVGGMGVARGYLGRPGLTAEKFIPDPFSADAGARMYRSGDRVRWRADGELDYVGRVDHQVKVRGFRIEPGEIEALLERHPSVREAAVIVREDAPGQARLVGYVVAEADADPSAADLRAYLRDRLPEYMVPAAIVVLDAFPLTPNGKLDRRGLPAPDAVSDADGYVAPRTPTEEILAGLFAEVLRVDRVGAEDDFFVLGGHSLLATRLISRIREAFAIELPLRALFEAPRVAALAARVDALAREDRGLAAPPVVPVDRDRPLPLSFAQQRLWFIDQLEPGSAAYNIAYALRLRGRLDVDALERSVTTLVARHEVLRTRFPSVDGEPVQVIDPAAPIGITRIDLTDRAADAREDELRALAVAEARRPFDLAAGPLFRSTLVRLGEDEHAVLFTLHHVVSDGWSSGILVREVSALYAAFVEGRDPHLPDLPVQYADFAAWQRAWLSGDVLDAQLGYWRERLADAPPLLELPTDRPRPRVQGDRGATVPFALSAETSRALRELARREGATLFMTLLAGWQLLLARYSGQDDVSVGTPVAGRTRLETEGLIGFFVNTLVLRTDLSGAPSFRQLLGRVRETTLGAYQHQDIPFEKLVEELAPERSLGHTPFFQAMFVLQNNTRDALRLGDLQAEALGGEAETAKFDLLLGMGDADERLAGALSYRTELFDAATIERMLGHLRALLDAIAEEPDRPVTELSFLADAERRRIVEAWNATDDPFDAEFPVHLRVSAQARRTPDAVAISFAGRATTYGELEAWSNRLAHALIRRGVGPEVRAAVCMERTPEMLVAMLAVMKAGGAYVPLDPAHPAERLRWVLRDADVRVLLTKGDVADAIAEDGIPVVRMDADAAEIDAESDALPEGGAGPANLAYVIYTSGSTGIPKGVQVEHRAVAALLHWLRKQVPDDEAASVLASTSTTFDVSVAEIFDTLCRGGKLVLVGNALDLAEVPADEDVRLAYMVPGAAAELLRMGAFPPSLRTLNLAGEALPAALARSLQAAGVRPVNIYGPTEGTVYVTLSEIAPGAERVTIGRPVPNTRAYVLDPEGKPVPVGIAGELYFGGAQVARGYLGRPGLTAEKFVPDPFSADAGARLYRTGDRARWTADGELDYLGRIDFQVKVRGFRIELGEIEAALKLQSGVRDAVVVVREDGAGERHLAAYLTAAEGAAPDAAALRAALWARLPEYMVPAAFAVLDAFPVTSSGKLDRRALPAPAFAAQAGAFVAPRTATEEILAGLFAAVLRVERVGAADDFFALGGHSLIATRLASRVREAFGIELPLRALFEASTVAALAERVDALRRAGAASAAPPLVPVDRDRPLPLSFAQQRLWFIDQLEPGSAAYHMPFALRVRGALDLPALERALAELVRRHEALRTRFAAVDGEPVQVIDPAGPFHLSVIDLTGSADAEGELRALAAEEARRPFDLATGPLMRSAAVRLAEDDHAVLFTLHHIVSDGWSMGVLASEVSQLYAAFADGRESPLPPLAVQYADYAVWQRAWLTGDVLDAQLGYWRAQLAGASPLLELPTDRPRPARPGDAAGRVPFALSADATRALRSLARDSGATVFMALLGGLGALLSRYAGQDDVVIGSPVANRTRLETEGLIGFFANTLALRADLAGDPTVRGLLARVRETVLEAQAHQDLPFERLVEELAPERSLQHSPLFQVLFVLQNAEAGAAPMGGLRTEPLGTGAEAARFDLQVTIADAGDAIRGALSYRAELWDAGSMERMAAHLARLLEGMADAPDRRLSEIGMLPDAERALVVDGWNATDAAYPADRCVHELFAATAARVPDAPAVESAACTLTYAELDARSNRLARHLRARGVGPDARVGICLERGPEMMVAVLGVLKAGAAYVPVDPAYPADRIAYMLEDSAAPVLLTQASLADALPSTGAAIVRIDADRDAIAAESDAPIASGAHPESLAYVIYTSGSTGRPKGVAMTHRPLVNLLAWQEGEWAHPAASATLQFTTLSFDVSFQEIFSCWHAGGRLVLVSEDERRDLAAVLTRLDEERIERLFLPYVALQHLAEIADERGVVPRALREVQTAGEQLRITAPIRRLFAATGATLSNQYGPSETHVVTAAVLAGAPETWPLLPGIGGPVANTRCYVLDPSGQPSPVGVPGELYLAGVCLARGYLSRPGLTAERFVPDAFAAAGARAYRTGDRARWLADGTLEFLGRVDDQVKVRGFRIEPGEIEAALETHDAVREAAVIVREDVAGDRRLVAYVVPAAESVVSAVELRAHLSGRLPEYMVPSAFVVLDQFPLTPSGKVARRALPAPDASAEADAYIEPRTPAEEILAGIYAEVLRVDRVGANGDFFALGGHSLLATRVVSRVRQAFGIDLPLRALFEAPTVAGLAERVQALRAAGGIAAPAIIPAAREESLPLSFAQERLWFIDQLQPGSAAYNMPYALRMGSGVDLDVLARALTALVARHETLRTVFPTEDGVPVQRVLSPSPIVPETHDLRHLPADEREGAAARLARDEASAPFDLARGPLARARVVRLGDADALVLLTLHHIVSDGWSQDLLARDLSELYAAFAEGREPALPALPVQYADYAVWQRAWLAGETLDEHLDYWRDALAGAPPLLELPTDRPRTTAPGARAESRSFVLSAEASEALRALSRREGATLFMTLLAAYQHVLSRWSGQDDVVVGTPVAGRSRIEVENLIGFFVNMLPLRTDLSGEPTFRALVQRVRETVLDAHAHEALPFEKLVDELQPERSLTHQPLFQVIFALQTEAREALRLGDAQSAAPAGGGEQAKFDLSLYAADRGERIAGSLVYRADLFDGGTIERLAAHLQALLEQAAADPDARLSALRLAGEDERRLVLEEWNRTDVDFPRDATVHALFEAQAARTPDALALEWGAERLTYTELDARADRLARHLVHLGVGGNARVGVLLERGVEMVVCVLAVLKAGGCCVPVDTSYPTERMRLMLADSAVRIVLTDDGLAGVLEEDEVREDGALHVVRIREAEQMLAAGSATSTESTGPVRGRGAAEDLAYVFYTSGSTGRPKGVMMGHREIVQLAWCVREVMPMEPGDRVAQASNASFDAAVFEIWCALAHGASLVGIVREVLLNAGALGRALRELGITHLYQTAALFSQHVREQVDVYASLRQLIFGAEAVGTESVRRMLRDGRPARVLHEYGPTEATVWCTLHPVEEIAEGAGTVSIGRPIPNARAYVVDRALEPAPIGVPGELYVGGEGVVRGYLGRPALTAEKFVPDPFRGVPGARMYRTGDRVRWRGDGRMEFMGRLDEQVKLRGFRIEPGEVEGALAAYPGVRGARVIVREDQPGDKRLVAYLVGEVDVDALRAHLRQRMPEYMVPNAFVVMDILPLTPNGKLDRRALPVPDYAPADDRYVAPRTVAEEVMAAIWAEVLRMERVGVEESFFELGGHSLLATRLISRVREAFAVELPLRVLFEAPTIAALAERVDALSREAQGPVAPPVVQVDRDRPLPLSFAQRRLWFIDQLEPGSAAYNIPYALRLRGRLDADALERSLAEIVRRHESLRTRFALVDDEPVQVIDPPSAFRLHVVDIADRAADEREREVRALAAAEARRPFDLAAGPLFRGTLVRLGEEEHAVFFTLHHVVSDGWSTGILVREVSALYAAYADGRDPNLPALPVQYADYAAWQRAWLDGEVLEAQLGWWRERLAGAPPLLELPTDRPRPLVQGERGASVPVTLDAETAGALRELARREGASLFMVLLAAWQLLLSRYSGQDDVSVGTPVAGRTRLETEGLIGFFVNTLVLRGDLSGNPGFRTLLARVRETTLGAHQHQDIPFEKLVEELAPERSLSHTPLFQVMFVLNNEDAGQALQLGGLTAERLGGESESAKFDLLLAFSDTGERLAGGLSYRTELFDAETAGRMAEHLAALLRAVVADPDRPVAELSFLGDAERRRIVEEWNATDDPFDAELPVHLRVSAQARRTPDAVAISFAGRATTYAELEAWSNRLAHVLRRRGVGPEVRAAVCMERAPEMLVAMLAVMKAGGAYVPLDPAHPAERLRWVLRDADVRVLLTVGDVADAIAEDGVPVVRMDADAAAIAAESDALPEGGAGPENLAYVIYTSGSTGIPKGVQVEHRTVAALLHWLRKQVRDDEAASVLASTSTTFDVSVAEIFDTLCRGGKLVLVGNALDLAEVPADEDVRLAYMVPGAAAELLRMGAFPPSMRTLNLAGEALPAALARGLQAAGVRPVNIYGPTEGTVYVTLSEIAPDAPRVTIGRPVPNTRAYVLDPALNPVPAGVAGELYFGGAQVVRGYLGRPGLTAERFVPDPFAAPGGRLYRTGDRVRWSADGEIEYLGRIDFQVKVRGFRIELGEVEAALKAQPGVRECVVVVREDRPGDRRLVAYLTADAGGAPTSGELRAALKDRLPEYMVPGAFVVLDAIPQTASGKTDRGALPAPESAADGNAFVAPRTPTEEIVAGMFAEVLRAERVGAHDDFFALGGHSLLATQVVTRVRGAFGVDVPLRALFRDPTVAGLAAFVDAGRTGGAGEDAPIQHVAEPGVWLPVSFAQQRLWFLQRIDPDSRVYNQVLAYRLRGRLDADALRRAVGELVRRHAVFRTRFEERGGVPGQVINPVEDARLPLIDLSGVADREAALKSIVQEQARRVFDLSTGELLRTWLVRLSETEHALVAGMHHITNDGWSVGIITREVAGLYHAFAEGRPSPFPELPVQYADFAAWQRAWLTPEREREQLDFWRARLDALPETTLAADRAGPPGGTEGETRGFALTPEVSEGVRRLSRTLGATPFMTLLAAFKVLLHWQGRMEDVVVGTDIANRNLRAETEGLIGFFVNQLVLRTDLAGNPDFREVVGRVREVTLAAYDHQDVPFDRVVEELRPRRAAGETPFFRVKFVLQNAPVGEPVQLPGLTLEPIGSDRGAAQLDLLLSMHDGGDRIRGWFEYRTSRLSPELVTRWSRRLAALLEAAVADPALPLDALAARLDAEDRRERDEAQEALKARRRARFGARGG